MRPCAYPLRKLFFSSIFLFLIFQNVGYSQTGIQFDGVNDYVTFGAAPTLSTQNFTIETWFKRTGTGISNTTGTGGITTMLPILTKGAPQADGSNLDANYILGINTSSNVIAADFEEGTGSTSPGLNHPISGTTVILNNVWYHAAATFENGVFSLYLNGVLENFLNLGASVWPQGASIQHSGLGTMLTSTGSQLGFFAGIIDEARIWNVARTQTEIQTNMSAELSSGTGLLGRWGLNDGSGTTAVNSIGGSPNGTLTNGPTWVTGITFPPELWGLKFNGTSQYVTFGTAPELNTTALTLEAWIKIEGAGVTTTTSGAGGGGFEGATAAVPIITKGRGEGESPDNINMNYFLGLVGNKLAADFEEASGPNHSVIGNTTIPLNIWTHVAATYEPVSAVWNLFINGELDKSLDIGSNIFPVSTSIQHAGLATAMTSSGSAAGFFAGSIDEVRIWNIARSESQIQSTINQEISSGTGLIGRWSLDEGSGTSASNSIGGSPNGTLTSGPNWVFGAPFNLVFTPPADPSALNVTAISSYQINLSWTDNSTNESYFEIERSTTGIAGTYTLLTTVTANTVTYSDISVNPSTEYCYKVRAVNGTGNSGYAGPTCATTPTEGDFALDLGSSGAYVTFGVAPSLATPTFTIETWFKKTGAGIANTTGTGGINIIPLLTKGSPEAEGSTVDANYILGIQSGTNFIAADFEEGTGSTSPGQNHPIVGTTAITNNVWHHAAATFENGVFKIYLDGILENTLTLTPAEFPQGASIQHAALGTMITSTGTAAGKFQGVLDEARIWNYERAEAQIQASINDQITTSQAGLLARWGLNEGSGTVIHANAGTTVNGTITGTGYSWVTPGAPFNIVFNPPAPPTGLGVNTISSTVLQLTWTDNSTDETGFQIERSTTGPSGPFSLLTTVAANTITYNNTGLTPSTNYCYRVRAINGGLGSAYTNIECATTNSSGPTTVSFQDGVNGYTGTRDTYTYNVSPSTIRGGEATFIQDLDAPPDERRSLLLFDISSIPTGVTIQSAQLQFYVNTEGKGFDMHRMLVPWDEATVTYASIGNRHFAPDNTDAETTVNANWPGDDGYTGLITVTVPASTIQDWVDGTIPNNGWLMIATDPFSNGGDGQQLRSRENTTLTPDIDHPKLSVTYATSPPNLPINPSPANNANAPSSSPDICATVSDPDGGNLTVRFYGRKKLKANAKTTIIGLPDTQYYTEEPQGQNSGGGGHNGIFKAQTQWIADHRLDSAIAFVVQLGDCVQNGDANQIEWKRADTSMKKIENPNVPVTDGIPYGICVGNHDQQAIGNPDGATLYYNQYFGESRFTGRGYYGGHYGVNNDNHYELFSGGGVDFIHISIEYYPNGTTASLQPVLDWADALLKAYPNRKGILSSHNMLGTGNPASFQGPGQKIYDDLKDNPNLILMLAGHVSGEGRRTDVFAGNTIHTLMSDYQSGFTNGGNGYLRIMQLLPSQNLLSVKTYSPYSSTSLTGSGSQFTLPVNLTQSFTLLGTNTNVPSGTQTCINWPSLDTASEYEWYVEVFDGASTTTGPVWTFKTPVGISGNVFHDANALLDNLVNSTSPIGIPTGLRVYMVNSNTSLIEGSTIVNPTTGTFNLNNVLPGTIYRFYLSSVSYPVGSPESVFPLVPILPGGWEHTGQKNANPPNSPTGSDGINDGMITVPVGANNMILINFGIRTKGGDVVSG